MVGEKAWVNPTATVKVARQIEQITSFGKRSNLSVSSVSSCSYCKIWDHYLTVEIPSVAVVCPCSLWTTRVWTPAESAMQGQTNGG